MSHTNKYSGHYHQSAIEEREEVYKIILQKKFTNLEELRLLEIGAGYGGNLEFFYKLGFMQQNLYANELLAGRAHVIQRKLPQANVYTGNALELDKQHLPPFDIVMQSTVFTSVLDANVKKNLANKLWELLKPGGIILWYDFVYNNPKNPEVKGIGKKEILELFPAATQSRFYPVTLAPPIGRLLPHLYKTLNSFPFLRSHLIAVMEKG